MLQPKIIDVPEMLVVGMEASFIHALSPEANNTQVIGALWNKFAARIQEVPHRLGEVSYGVLFSKPAAERRHPDELQYLAAVAVSKADEIPEGMRSFTVPAGTFAVFTHRGPMSEIGETVAQIYHEWLPQSQYQHAHIVDVERYDERACTDSGAAEMEYCISVVSRVPMAG